MSCAWATVDEKAFPAKSCPLAGTSSTASSAAGFIKSSRHMPWHLKSSLTVKKRSSFTLNTACDGRTHVDTPIPTSGFLVEDVDVSTKIFLEWFWRMLISIACFTFSSAFPRRLHFGNDWSKTSSNANVLLLDKSASVAAILAFRSLKSWPSSRSAKP